SRREFMRAEIEPDRSIVERVITRYVEAPAACHDYDPRAPLVASFIAEIINSHMADVLVEHIGSTSIPGCAGKAVIDLMALYPEGRLAAVKTLLEALGFQHQSTRDPFPESRPMRLGSIEYNESVFRIHVHVIAADSSEAQGLR